LSWARIAALIMRLTQGCFCPYEEARIQCYVDDPATMLRGTGCKRRRMAAIIVLISRSLGFELSFRKAYLGANPEWIGAILEINRCNIRVTLKPGTIADLKNLIAKYLATNVIPLKKIFVPSPAKSHTLLP
jgi:hypothetical protein